MSRLAPTLQAFFTDRLINQTEASPRTIAAYRDTFRLLLAFTARQIGKQPSELDLDDLDARLIGAFLNHLQADRGNTARTRNARLAAIHSFCRYAAFRHPEHAATIARVIEIPSKPTPGSRLGLVPHPRAEASRQILLVEGPPDMIAARSRGLPAIAVPGDHSWQPQWAQLLAGRDITIVMDADAQGRAAARRITDDLITYATPHIVDLAPHRDDGYDLTDWLLDHREHLHAGVLSRCTHAHHRTRQP
jgi:hypothetical protein